MGTADVLFLTVTWISCALSHLTLFSNVTAHFTNAPVIEWAQIPAGKFETFFEKPSGGQEDVTGPDWP